MFLTAIVWGLGVSLGGSVGLMSFFVMFHFFKYWANEDSLRELKEFQEAQLAALEERNLLTIRTNEQLLGIKTGLNNVVEVYREERIK